MAKHRKRRGKAHRANVSRAHRSRRRRTNSHHRRRSRNVSRRSLMSLMRRGRRGHRRRRSSNPMATHISLTRPAAVIQAAVGVLVGVAATRAIVAALPANISGSSLYSTVAAVAIAVGIWWLGSMISPEFGAAAGLGGIAEAGSIALNQFLPSVGSVVSLGDFVPGRFTVPQNPVLDAATGLPKRVAAVVAAYPRAYAVA
jgi:hypothetical protein